jgi:DNA-binding transcriptional ArsR family regulator
MHPTVKLEKQQSAFEITTAKEQKAYFHPVRMKILNFLTRERLTISQTAGRLKVHPANITHHFRVLQGAGLIRLVEERDIRRVVEKYYEAVATLFNIRPPEGSVKSVNRKGLSFLRDDLSASIDLLKTDDSEDVFGQIETARIDAKTFMAFAKRLRSLIVEFENIACKDGTKYALNLSLYPHNIDYGPIGKYELKKKRRLKVVK